MDAEQFQQETELMMMMMSLQTITSWLKLAMRKALENTAFVIIVIESILLIWLLFNAD